MRNVLYFIVLMAVTSCSTGVKKGNLKLSYLLSSPEHTIEVNELKEIILKRLLNAGYSESYIHIKPIDNHLQVIINYADNPNRLRSILTMSGQLEFARIYTSQDLHKNFKSLEENKYFEKEEALVIEKDLELFDGIDESQTDSSNRINKEKNLFDYIYSARNATVPEIGFAPVQDTAKINKLLRMNNDKFPKNCRFLWSKQSNDDILKLYGTIIEDNENYALHGDLITKASQQYTEMGNPMVSFQFNEMASKEWEELTRLSLDKHIAMILDNKVYTAPKVLSPIIGGQCQLTGFYSREECQDLATAMMACLPYSLEIINSSSEVIK